MKRKKEIESAEVGQRIKQIREALKLKQKDFAEKINMSGPSLSELETGKYKPGFDILVNLSKLFNVNLYFILFGQGEMFIDPLLSPYNRLREYAVNIDDVRDFFYHFEHSSILQYYILNTYKSRMMTDKEPITREIEEKKLKAGKK